MFVLHANNKGADQPALSQSLSSAFAGHYLESIVEILLFYLVSIVEKACLEPYLARNEPRRQAFS